MIHYMYIHGSDLMSCQLFCLRVENQSTILPACPPVFLYVCLALHLSICLPISICLSVCLYLPVCLPISMDLSVCLPISIYLSVCLYLSVGLSSYLYLSVCLYLPVCLSAYMPISTCLSVCLYLSVRPSICLSVCLCTCPSVSLSVFLHVCLFFLIAFFVRKISSFALIFAVATLENELVDKICQHFLRILRQTEQEHHQELPLLLNILQMFLAHCEKNVSPSIMINVSIV